MEGAVMEMLNRPATNISIRQLTSALIWVLMLVCLCVIPVRAQAQDAAATLRERLAEVQSKQEELQARVLQLQEDIKPENIERSLAGVGSTHPEQLRDQRHRQLEIQLNGVKAQLDSLAASRVRLEESIARADADSYRQSAGVVSSASQTPAGDRPATSVPPKRRKRRPAKRRKPVVPRTTANP